jgi:hypothetical protein
MARCKGRACMRGAFSKGSAGPQTARAERVKGDGEGKGEVEGGSCWSSRGTRVRGGTGLLSLLCAYCLFGRRPIGSAARPTSPPLPRRAFLRSAHPVFRCPLVLALAGATDYPSNDLCLRSCHCTSRLCLALERPYIAAPVPFVPTTPLVSTISVRLHLLGLSDAGSAGCHLFLLLSPSVAALLVLCLLCTLALALAITMAISFND